MVPLALTAPVRWRDIGEYLRHHWPDFAAVGELDGSEDAAVLPFAGGSVGFGYMPMPIPWSDLEWPVETAWHWPEARTALEPHQAHLIIYASSTGLSQVELTLGLTQAVASAVATTSAVGVYYGNAVLVIAPDRYIAEAQESSSSRLPILLWLGFHPVPEERGLSAYTTGMKTFDLLDLEAHDTSLPPDELVGRLADIAHYQLTAGIQLGDGDTVGSSPDECIQVHHRPSRFGDRSVTCQISF